MKGSTEIQVKGRTDRQVNRSTEIQVKGGTEIQVKLNTEINMNEAQKTSERKNKIQLKCSKEIQMK